MITISHNFLNKDLAKFDPEIASAIEQEFLRQQNNLELIASENIVSTAVLAAQGSVMTNKYAEGYPGKRYYGGCEYVDIVESLVIERAKQLFNAKFVNVQPHSGSQANQTVFMALLQPYDTILSLSLDCGGHLTHGSPVNQSGKWFKAVHYPVHTESGLIDYDKLQQLAREHSPKLIITGYSAYPRQIDFAKFRAVADSVGAYLLVDMAHIAGFIAAGLYENPLDYAHVVTSTTHKTLRGPRGGIVLTNHEEMAKMINSALFPGLQGGPLMNVIAAKAVALKEALEPGYKEYIKQVVKNAQTLAEGLKERGYTLVTGGTDNHIVLIDLRTNKLTGKTAEASMCRAGLTCNKNSVPYDPEKPWVTSGLRLGTSATTTRGLKEAEFKLIAGFIADVLDGLKAGDNAALEAEIKQKVLAICQQFPIYT